MTRAAFPLQLCLHVWLHMDTCVSFAIIPQLSPYKAQKHIPEGQSSVQKLAYMKVCTCQCCGMTLYLFYNGGKVSYQVHGTNSPPTTPNPTRLWSLWCLNLTQRYKDPWLLPTNASSSSSLGRALQKSFLLKSIDENMWSWSESSCVDAGAPLGADQCLVRVHRPLWLHLNWQEHSPVVGDFTEAKGGWHSLDCVPVARAHEAPLAPVPEGGELQQLFWDRT